MQQVQDTAEKDLFNIDLANDTSLELLNRKEVLESKKGYWVIRRTQDIILSAFAFVVLFPFLLIIALIIFLDDPHGSPLFKQKRCGRDGKLFTMHKFRTMFTDAEERLYELQDLNEKDGPVFKIKDDPRITRVGHFLRKTGLDELPQLINILVGDMSIVGPRPPLPKEVAKYNEIQKQRLYVTPGLTCYWQIQENRDAISFDDWVALDLKYIKERSFSVDWKIIFLTFKAVVTRQGE